MKIIIIKFLTIILTLILFVISLTKNAIISSHMTNNGVEINTSDSLSFFLMGSTGILGGAVLEQIIWLANPLCLIAIIMFLNNNVKSKKLCFIALILALSFAFWDEILANEGGGMAKIVSLESGYFLWISSIIILNIGVNLCFMEMENEGKR